MSSVWALFRFFVSSVWVLCRVNVVCSCGGFIWSLCWIFIAPLLVLCEIYVGCEWGLFSVNFGSVWAMYGLFMNSMYRNVDY